MAKLRAGLRRVAPALARDAAGLSGCALITYGAWQAYAPAGFITAGVMLVAFTALTVRR